MGKKYATSAMKAAVSPPPGPGTTLKNNVGGMVKRNPSGLVPNGRFRTGDGQVWEIPRIDPHTGKQSPREKPKPAPKKPSVNVNIGFQ